MKISLILLFSFFWSGLAGPALPHAMHPSDSPVQIVKHHCYTLGYCEEYEQAAWVAYTLIPSQTKGQYKRASGFYEDPLVATGSAANADYTASGYDRGHLAPAGDMSFSAIAMKESFYYSNMSPQKPGFNRGIWKKLETRVRQWSAQCDSLRVVTGPVLSNIKEYIGPDSVAVPAMYYKALLFYHGQQVSALGFLMQNCADKRPLSAFVVPVDRVEAATGYDFFADLPDEMENKIEAVSQPSAWQEI